MLFDPCIWNSEQQLHRLALRYQDNFEIEHRIMDLHKVWSF